MADKSSDKKLFIVLGLLFLFLAIAYAVSLGPLSTPEVDVAEEQVETIENAYGEEVDTTSQGEETEDDALAASSSTAESTESPVEESSFDFSLAKKERILGDRSAPIKIVEHSSFSCGHCGKFHNETFDEFKSAYIDTGKAYLVFSDFPFNAPALHATMAGRCIAEDRDYFNYVRELFESQEEWADKANYLSYLETKAAEYGLDQATFKACVENEELKEFIVKRMQAAQGQWGVRSTPSFVVNNQKVITGALSFRDFEKAIQDAIAEIESNTAPVEGKGEDDYRPYAPLEENKEAE